MGAYLYQHLSAGNKSQHDLEKKRAFAICLQLFATPNMHLHPWHSNFMQPCLQSARRGHVQGAIKGNLSPNCLMHSPGKGTTNAYAACTVLLYTLYLYCMPFPVYCFLYAVYWYILRYTHTQIEYTQTQRQTHASAHTHTDSRIIHVSSIYISSYLYLHIYYSHMRIVHLQYMHAYTDSWLGSYLEQTSGSKPISIAITWCSRAPKLLLLSPMISLRSQSMLGLCLSQSQCSICLKIANTCRRMIVSQHNQSWHPMTWIHRYCSGKPPRKLWRTPVVLSRLTYNCGFWCISKFEGFPWHWTQWNFYVRSFSGSTLTQNRLIWMPLDPFGPMISWSSLLRCPPLQGKNGEVHVMFVIPIKLPLHKKNTQRAKCSALQITVKFSTLESGCSTSLAKITCVRWFFSIQSKGGSPLCGTCAGL